MTVLDSAVRLHGSQAVLDVIHVSSVVSDGESSDWDWAACWRSLVGAALTRDNRAQGSDCFPFLVR